MSSTIRTLIEQHTQAALDIFDNDSYVSVAKAMELARRNNDLIRTLEKHVAEQRRAAVEEFITRLNEALIETADPTPDGNAVADIDALIESVKSAMFPEEED